MAAAATVKPAEILVIGGRRWKPLTKSTIEHDFTTMRHIREAGLNDLRKGAEESYEDYAVRLLHEIIGSGKAFILLGCFLVPEGTQDEQWTAQLADQTAEFMRTLTSDEDKGNVQMAVISMLNGFFLSGLRFERSIRTASSQGSQQPSTRKQHIDNVPALPY
jgi:hypothetical protein